MDLGADPVKRPDPRLWHHALNLLLVTLAVTPLRRLTGWTTWSGCGAMLGLFAFFYVLLHFHGLRLAGPAAGLCRHRRGHREAPLHHHRHAGTAAAGAAGGDFDQSHDAPPRPPLDAAAQAGLRDHRPRAVALLVAGEEDIREPLLYVAIFAVLMPSASKRSSGLPELREEPEFQCLGEIGHTAGTASAALVADDALHRLHVLEAPQLEAMVEVHQPFGQFVQVPVLLRVVVHAQPRPGDRLAGLVALRDIAVEHSSGMP